MSVVNAAVGGERMENIDKGMYSGLGSGLGIP
jgi:hypothetical protein